MKLLNNEQHGLMEALVGTGAHVVIRRRPKKDPICILDGGSVSVNFAWNPWDVLTLWNMGWLSMNCHHGKGGRQEVRWELTTMGKRSFNIIRGN